MQKEPSCNPEVWGGIECTINRVGDQYSDQLELTGHYRREQDIDMLAMLRIKTLRYPILWERHQPEKDGRIDWSWTARQLDSIRQHDITPIAGLIHHGSGPSFTDLLSPDFAAGLADYARLVAEQFPWIEYYTPVNEPLTTARFSGLYGIWYPHTRDHLKCMLMLLNQVKATVLAMKAIRKVNHTAKLIQTEDLTRIHSSSALAYQAAFENHRRWLTFDLLAGKVDKTHPLWDYLLFIGIDETALDFFVQNPCPPDIMGCNYYITSERYLDIDIDKYPVEIHGGNGIDRYVDTEAVRVIRPAGLLNLLTEAWNRYHWPIAITEAHLNCTREEQLRWLKQIWDQCCIGKDLGLDIRAVTVWSLLGACDWDSLLTTTKGHYESGAFDVRGSIPGMTALGHLTRSLATDGGYDHPLLVSQGWWEDNRSASESGKLWLIGDEGKCEVIRQLCSDRGIACHTPDHAEPLSLDLFAADSERPWGIILLYPGPMQRNLLAARCRDQQMPFQSLPVDDMQDRRKASRALDLFIDKTFSLYIINDHEHASK